jgi:hypothetical protein
MDQPVPKVTQADATRIAKRDFGPANEASVIKILSDIPLHGSAINQSRVQLAVLKLAAGNREFLLAAAATASTDFRDVIAPAEYPRYIKQSWADVADVNIRPEVIRDDWAQYSNWLERENA